MSCLCHQWEHPSPSTIPLCTWNEAHCSDWHPISTSIVLKTTHFNLLHPSISNTKLRQLKTNRKTYNWIHYFVLYTSQPCRSKGSRLKLHIYSLYLHSHKFIPYFIHIPFFLDNNTLACDIVHDHSSVAWYLYFFHIYSWYLSFPQKNAFKT